MNVQLIILISSIVCIGSSSILKNSNKIICESYTAKLCADNNDCEVKTEECVSESPDKLQSQSCYVVWTLQNGQPNITLKGCFADHKECDQSECISRAEPKNGLYFCCCKGSMCNTHHDHIPTTTEATTQVPKELTADNNATCVIIAFIVLILLMISFTFGILLYRRKKQAMFNEIPTIEPEVSSSSPNLAIRPVHLIEMKARGRFGAVWHARLHSQMSEKLAPPL